MNPTDYGLGPKMRTTMMAAEQPCLQQVGGFPAGHGCPEGHALQRECCTALAARGQPEDRRNQQADTNRHAYSGQRIRRNPGGGPVIAAGSILFRHGELLVHALAGLLQGLARLLVHTMSGIHGRLHESALCHLHGVISKRAKVALQRVGGRSRRVHDKKGERGFLFAFVGLSRNRRNDHATPGSSSSCSSRETRCSSNRRSTLSSCAELSAAKAAARWLLCRLRPRWRGTSAQSWAGK